MSAGGTLVTALLVTLARPSTWILALASFLVRGGILLLCLPIIFIPTPIGVANLVGPTLVGFVFGGVSMAFVALVVSGVLGVLGWLVIGGAVAAAAEAAGTRVVAEDDDVADGGGAIAEPQPGAAGRILAVRLFALVPLLIVLLWGAALIVAVAYRELTLPSDVTRPILWRVVGAVPEVVALIAAAWVLGEIVSALAARRIVLDGAGVARAFRGAVVDLVRRPLRFLTLFVVPTAVLVVVLIPVAAASGVAWDVLRDALRPGTSPIQLAAALIGFVGLWLGGLVLAAMIAAWRQAVWTVDLAGRHGTLGHAAATRPGDWNTGSPSVTL